MKPHAWFLLTALCLGGCNVVAWGNMVLLGVTLAMFCATLSLGRHVSVEDRTDTTDQETFVEQ